MRTTHVLLFGKLPRPDSPILEVKLLRHDSVAFEVKPTYRATPVSNRTWNFVGALVSAGAAAALISHGDSTTTRGRTLNIGAVAAVLASLGFFVAATDTNSVLPGMSRLIEGRTEVAAEIRERPDSSGATIQIRVDTARRQYVLGPSGIAMINLVSDFNLRRFSQTIEIPVVVSSRNDAPPIETRLLSNRWTVLCARSAGTGAIQAAASARSQSVGSFSAGDSFRVTSDSVEDWLQIEYRGARGWLPRLAADLFWTTPPDCVR